MQEAQSQGCGQDYGQDRSKNHSQEKQKSKAQGRQDFTPTELKMLDVLSDGLRHSKFELLKCCDEYSQYQMVAQHITSIRKKLPDDETIVCVVYGRRNYYQHVKLLNPLAKRQGFRHASEVTGQPEKY